MPHDRATVVELAKLTGKLKASAEEQRPPEFSDDALALIFIDQRHDDLRYVAAFGSWFQWNAGLWAEDRVLAVWDAVRITCRTAAGRCKRQKVSTAIKSAKTVAAVERLARTDQRTALAAEQWDLAPDLLNHPWSAR